MFIFHVNYNIFRLETEVLHLTKSYKNLPNSHNPDVFYAFHAVGLKAKDGPLTNFDLRRINI